MLVSLYIGLGSERATGTEREVIARGGLCAEGMLKGGASIGGGVAGV